MVAPLERHDISDHRDAPLSTEPTEAKDPIEKADHAEPTEPTDRTDPTEPIESTDPRDHSDRTESVEPIDQRDPLTGATGAAGRGTGDVSGTATVSGIGPGLCRAGRDTDRRRQTGPCEPAYHSRR
jgi:hypothetical protein